jgi:hypothetical protein
MKYTEIAEELLVIQSQAKALMSLANGLLRRIEPLVAKEQQEAAGDGRRKPRTFGQPRED